MNGKFYAPTASPPKKKQASGTHRKEGSIGPSAGLDGLQEKMFAPARSQTVHPQLFSQ